MSESTPSQPITESDVYRTFLVLETIRDEYLEEPEHTVLNAAHSLVQQFEDEITLDEPTETDATVNISFRELVQATEAEPFFMAGYDVDGLDWKDGGLQMQFNRAGGVPNE